MWTRSPKNGRGGHEVQKAVKVNTKSWTRSPKSSKDGHEVQKAVKMNTKSEKAVKVCSREGIDLPETGLAVGAVACLLGMPQSLKRPGKKFCFGNANEFPFPKASMRGLWVPVGHFARCAADEGVGFVCLSFCSPFATDTSLGAAPLNLKGMSSPSATIARLEIFSRASLLPYLLPRSPRGVFDLVGSILLALEFERAKGSKDSTSECVAFYLRR
ncbi:hypothetical protein CRG98_013763 [Punica granatum]|uniref:Uncharacterized protein n=1 Tax=Punica granatum TaxID=22663 RepID=A0A2I0KBF2_PUNGR|nr:hypothetical protein CRG98_013763 [Punica granatum]